MRNVAFLKVQWSRDSGMYSDKIDSTSEAILTHFKDNPKNDWIEVTDDEYLALQKGVSIYNNGSELEVIVLITSMNKAEIAEELDLAGILKDMKKAALAYEQREKKRKEAAIKRKSAAEQKQREKEIRKLEELQKKYKDDLG